MFSDSSLSEPHWSVCVQGGMVIDSRRYAANATVTTSRTDMSL